jgi:hypothetical protein
MTEKHDLARADLELPDGRYLITYSRKPKDA